MLRKVVGKHTVLFSLIKPASVSAEGTQAKTTAVDIHSSLSFEPVSFRRSSLVLGDRMGTCKLETAHACFESRLHEVSNTRPHGKKKLKKNT